MNASSLACWGCGGSRALPFLQEGRDGGYERLGLLEIRVVPRRREHLKPRAGDELRIGLAVLGGHDPVARAPEHERGDVDPPQPGPEARVVHERLPGELGDRLAAAE